MYSIKIKVFCLLASIAILDSCSVIPQQIGGKWRAAYDGLANYYSGYPDYEITPEIVKEIPYASLKMKIGDGPAGLVILQEVNNNIYTWASADNVIFSIRNGRIIETHGLINNVMNVTSALSDETFPIKGSEYQSNDFVRVLSLSKPRVNSLTIKVKKNIIGQKVIYILGKEFKTLLIEETITNDYIGWRYNNYFWVDEETGFVWKSIQQIAPNLPAIKIEILKKPA